MKKTFLLLMMVLIPIAFFNACGSSTDANDEDEGVQVNPDLYFKMEASGAENFEVEFELEGGVAKEYSANGAWTSNVQLFQIIVLDLTPGWQLALVASNTEGITEGTYQMNTTSESPDIGSFLNVDHTETYLSIYGEITVTKAEELTRPGPGASHWINGTFEIGLVEADAHPATTASLVIEGEFTGVYIGSNIVN